MKQTSPRPISKVSLPWALIYTGAVVIAIQWIFINNLLQSEHDPKHNDKGDPIYRSVTRYSPSYLKQSSTLQSKHPPNDEVEQGVVSAHDADLIWKGDVSGGNPGHYHHITLVISQCLKDLSWVNNFTRGYEERIRKIYIYSKCGKKVTNAPFHAEVIELDNVGRCDHSFAYWMARMADDTPDNDVIIFMKDNRDMHQVANWRTLSDMLRITSVQGFACGQILQTRNCHEFVGERKVVAKYSLSTYHKLSGLLLFHSQNYVRNPDTDKDNEFKSKYVNMGEWVNDLKMPFPSSLVQVCYGANFAVEASRIKKHKRDFWQRLEQSLSRGDNIEEGHFAERSWAGLLSKPLTDKEQLAVYFKSTQAVNHHLRCCVNEPYVGILVSDTK